jgi:hypothetical protein
LAGVDYRATVDSKGWYTHWVAVEQQGKMQRKKFGLTVNWKIEFTVQNKGSGL